MSNNVDTYDPRIVSKIPLFYGYHLVNQSDNNFVHYEKNISGDICTLQVASNIISSSRGGISELIDELGVSKKTFNVLYNDLRCSPFVDLSISQLANMIKSLNDLNATR